MRTNPSTDCKCDKCGATAKSIPGKRHRRCPGENGKAIRDKDKKIAPADRGEWRRNSSGE